MSKKTNPTTNYPKSSHKEFCQRCYNYHGKTCPVTKSVVRADKDECNL